MTESIDLTKYRIMTDSMYDTTGTQMNEPKRTMIYTTPFEGQPKYNMRAGNKPFQASKYPSSGYEWYAKRAVNDVDLQTDMEKVLPDQQVQNWSRAKTVVIQKEDAQPKETAVESQLEKSRNSEIQKTLDRIKRRRAAKKKEGYITSPYGDYEDTWSSAGRIKDQLEEKFTVAGKEFEVIDIIIVILAIVIIVVAIYMYINRDKAKPTPKPSTSSSLDVPTPVYMTKSTPTIKEEKRFESVPMVKSTPPPPKPTPTVETTTTKSTGDLHGGKIINCGSLCGGAAFDTRI